MKDIASTVLLVIAILATFTIIVSLFVMIWTTQYDILLARTIGTSFLSIFTSMFIWSLIEETWE